jgi:hypothetical protein
VFAGNVRVAWRGGIASGAARRCLLGFESTGSGTHTLTHGGSREGGIFKFELGECPCVATETYNTMIFYVQMSTTLQPSVSYRLLYITNTIFVCCDDT